MEDKKRPSPSSDPTRVDLGEDLLEKTQPTAATEIKKPRPFDPDDEIESARILFNEGFNSDAKKKLRAILLKNPSNISAKKMLQEIQSDELKNLLSSRVTHDSRRENLGRAAEGPIDSEAVMRNLDRDFRLGVFGQTDEAGQKSALENQAREFLRNATARDRIDLGIALAEMGLFNFASSVFEDAAKSAGDVATRVSAVCLQAYTRIAMGDGALAMICTEPLVRDLDIPEENKVEVFYMMGRACEQMNRPEKAHSWYRKVVKIDPDYRDAKDRLRNPLSIP